MRRRRAHARSPWIRSRLCFSCRVLLQQSCAASSCGRRSRWWAAVPLQAAFHVQSFPPSPFSRNRQEPPFRYLQAILFSSSLDVFMLHRYLRCYYPACHAHALRCQRSVGDNNNSLPRTAPSSSTCNPEYHHHQRMMVVGEMRSEGRDMNERSPHGSTAPPALSAKAHAL